MNEGLPEGEHAYHFVGKAGLFCPVMDGEGGGILLRENKERTKYDSVNGTKGYRWLESEEVKDLGKHINKEYYISLCNDAIEHIKEFGDYEWFIDETETEFIPF